MIATGDNARQGARDRVGFLVQVRVASQTSRRARGGWMAVVVVVSLHCSRGPSATDAEHEVPAPETPRVATTHRDPAPQSSGSTSGAAAGDAPLAPAETSGSKVLGFDLDRVRADAGTGDTGSAAESGTSDATPAEGNDTAAIPKISVPKVTVGPSGDKEVIRRVIRKHIGDVKRCYEKGLLRDPSLRGRVLVNFTILADGSVGAATVATGATLTDATVQTCITDAVKSWTFPTPRGGGILKIAYPFVFTPSP